MLVLFEDCLLFECDDGDLQCDVLFVEFVDLVWLEVENVGLWKLFCDVWQN